MTIQEYFGDWSKIIDLDRADAIMKRLYSEKGVCPLYKDIFKAFKLCPLNTLRVVIIGMDPYSTLYKGKPTATGIAFGNSPDTPENAYSPSLEVLKESVIDFTIPHSNIIFDPSLEKWEEQGVLMLNSALSCNIGKTGSHTLLWRPFIKSLISNLSRFTTGIVYVLLGESAQSLESCIDVRFNHIIKEKHPAYYARTDTKMPYDLWVQINKILIGQNGYGIEWYSNINC